VHVDELTHAEDDVRPARPAPPPQGVATAEGAALPERVVVVRLRTMLTAIGLVLGVALAAEVVVRAKAGLTLIAIAAFLALALNPAVAAFERRGLRRGGAVAAIYALALATVACIAVVLVPPLVEQVVRFIDALPQLVADLTDGRGPLGFLETKYHVVERVRDATQGDTALTREASSAVRALRDVATSIFGVVVVSFLTLFMLLEGPEWRRRVMALTPERHRPAVQRVGTGVYRSVAGFVTGNLLASLLAGIVVTGVMLVAGVPYAVPLGLFVAIVELVPFIGAFVATLVVTAVALTQGSATAIAVFAVLVAYHMVDGHILRPLLYGRAVALSPLTVLVSLLVCTELAGVLGALAAIPVAGSVNVVLREAAGHWRDREGEPVG
jgi:predicted PurR-regulated permease PerM